MCVCAVDEAGHDAPAASVDDAVFGPPQRLDLGVRADGDDAARRARRAPGPRGRAGSPVQIFAERRIEVGGARARARREAELGRRRRASIERRRHAVEETPAAPSRRARRARPRGARSARGRASRRRSRGPVAWKNSIERGIAAVLAADADLELRVRLAAALASRARRARRRPPGRGSRTGPPAGSPSRCTPAGTTPASSRE